MVEMSILQSSSDRLHMHAKMEVRENLIALKGFRMISFSKGYEIPMEAGQGYLYHHHVPSWPVGGGK